MIDVGHWDVWGWSGMKTISRPEPNSTPERAMELPLEKAKLVFGEQERSAWERSAREYGTRQPRPIRFRHEGGAFVRVAAN